MINGETLGIALGMIGMGLCIATLPYLINDNCDLCEEKHDTLGFVNALAASGGAFCATLLCCLHTVSAIVCAIVFAVLLLLSAFNRNSKLRLKILNSVMWGFHIALLSSTLI